MEEQCSEADVNRTSVLVVEDHHIFREAVVGYIEAHQKRFQLVAAVATAAEGLSVVEEHVPDIVLLDLGLPHTHSTDDGVDQGLKLIGDIQAISPQSKIIVLTGHRTFNTVFRAIQAGAATYLLKENVTGEQLISAIVQVCEGTPPIDQGVARKLWDYFQNPAQDNGPPVREMLTAREEEVIRLISQGLSNAEIAEKLVISVKTVKRHVSNMLSKLQFSNRLELSFYYRTRHLQETGQSSLQTPLAV
jgi:DNA-binding NarL/FixJ family response regulator